MNELRYVLKKFGGMQLVMNYLKTHTFLFVLLSFCLNGKSKTGLEITRLGQQLKVKNKIEKKYKKILTIPLENSVQEYSNFVWVSWLQGMDDAPNIIKTCYRSIVKVFYDRNIKLITSENFSEYVQIPQYIVKKWQAGIISDTHFSDILRMELLSKYGGIWIDASVFISYRDEEFLNMLKENDLFFFQKVKPGADGNAISMSSWFISCKKNNPVIKKTRNLLRKYWQENNALLDYFLLHYFLQLVLDYNKKYADLISKYDNSTPHILLLKLNDEYDPKMFNNICNRIPINKLTYKNIEENKENTFYSYLVNNY